MAAETDAFPQLNDAELLRAAATGGVFVVVGAATAIIMAGVDRAFTRLIHPREG